MHVVITSRNTNPVSFILFALYQIAGKMQLFILPDATLLLKIQTTFKLSNAGNDTINIFMILKYLLLNIASYDMIL